MIAAPKEFPFLQSMQLLSNIYTCSWTSCLPAGIPALSCPSIFLLMIANDLGSKEVGSWGIHTPAIISSQHAQHIGRRWTSLDHPLSWSKQRKCTCSACHMHHLWPCLWSTICSFRRPSSLRGAQTRHHERTMTCIQMYSMCRIARNSLYRACRSFHQMTTLQATTIVCIQACNALRFHVRPLVLVPNLGKSSYKMLDRFTNFASRSMPMKLIRIHIQLQYIYFQLQTH